MKRSVIFKNMSEDEERCYLIDSVGYKLTEQLINNAVDSFNDKTIYETLYLLKDIYVKMEKQFIR